MNKIYFAISGLVIAFIACQTTATPTTQPPASATPAVNTTASSTTNCTVGNYDLPHSATKVGGKELYDLAAKEPSNAYLEVESIVTEAQHLVSPNDGVDGTLIFSHIDDPEGNTIHQYYLLIYLPDGGAGVSEISTDSRVTTSGLYVGYVSPPANLFTAFPNKKGDTKFPSIKAEIATYGCP